MKKTFENLEEGDVVYIVRKNGYTVTEVCQINTLDTGEIRFYLTDGFIGGYLYNPKNNHLISVDTIVLNKEDILKKQIQLTKKHLSEIFPVFRFAVSFCCRTFDIFSSK